MKPMKTIKIKNLQKPYEADEKHQSIKTMKNIRV